MPQLIEAPLGALDEQEAVHFPWAHVEDFRRFFGLDRLLEYTRTQTSTTTRIFSKLLGLRTRQAGLAERLSSFSASTIASARFAETMFEVRGELASFRHLDATVREAYPQVAQEQRRLALAEYLYDNEVIDEVSLEAPMRTNRLLGLFAYHADDFWIGEHRDLFALVSTLNNGAQTHFAISVILAAIPGGGISPDQASRFAQLFVASNAEVLRVIRELQSALPESPSSIVTRASLQQIRSSAREYAPT